MNEKRKCLIGHDSDDDALVELAMAIIIVMVVVTIIVCGGAFIGGYHSLKNYFLSFKHNIYDSNKIVTAA